MGQHRHRRVDGIPDADQGELPVPQFDSRGAARPRPRALQRLRASRRHEGHPGVALLLLQEPHGGSRSPAGARSLHPADEAQEHASSPHGRRADHAPRTGVLPVVTPATAARAGITGAFVIVLVGAVSCGPPRKPELRQGSPSYSFTITSDPVPPHAREDIIYTITVKDRKTGQPIETGEGRIFANTREMAPTYDAFVKAPQVAAYSPTLNFLTPPQPPVGIHLHTTP